MSDTDASFIDRHRTTINWLLEPENPSVRHRTLLDLMKYPDDDQRVLEAKAAIQQSRPVLKLLRQQRPDGTWSWPTDWKQGSLWTEKGTIFSLLLLGELGATCTEGTDRAFDHLHKHFQLESGLISYKAVKTRRRYQSQSTSFWCITAVTLRAALLLGYTDHPLVHKALSFFETFQNEKGGWYCSAYSRNPEKVQPRNCYMGIIKVLNALSLIPSHKRSKKLRLLIKQGVSTCLENRVHFYRVDRHGQPTMKRAWRKFAFPRYWRSDTLEATNVLIHLGVRDKRLSDALDFIQSKQQPDGRWLLDFSETKRAWIQIEHEGKTSKWISLRALSTLLNAGKT